MIRQLPPTAVPLSWSELRQGLNPPPDARERFQTALAQYLAVRACYLASSGRTAFYLALKSLLEGADKPSRREVILPAYTCPALAKVVLDLELRPRLVDISPQTLAFEVDGLMARISEQTLAVIWVHPFGIPHSLADGLDQAHAKGAAVIEDAAQALGSRLDGRPVGTQGDLGLFSLGPGKPLSTGGGGVLCTSNDRYARLLEQTRVELSRPSALASRWAPVRQTLFTVAFHPTAWWLATRAGLHNVGNYETSWTYRLGELTDGQAAVGSALLDSLEAINSKRRANALQLISQLEGIDYVQFPEPSATAEPIYLRLPVIVSETDRRENLFQRLWSAGIGVGRMYRRPLSEIFPQLAEERYPGAEYVARHLLTLPTHHYLTEADVERTVHIFRHDPGGKQPTSITPLLQFLGPGWGQDILNGEL
jgi:dTDP-4-amino-4,6-dideoxygalactose transaminase